MAAQVKASWRNHTDSQEEDLVSTSDVPTDVESCDARQGDLNAPNNSSSNQEPFVYTSQLATLFITVNATIGAGLLAIPAAVQESGIITATIAQVIFLVLVITTCIMCVELTMKNDIKSYHQIVEIHCHRYVFALTQLLIILNVFGATAAFLVIIGDQSDRLFASLYGPHFCAHWYLERRFIISILTVFVAKPLCAIKTVDFLKYTSYLGVASLGFIFYVVLHGLLSTHSIAPDVKIYPHSWHDTISILPLYCFCYQCHLSLVPTVATVCRGEKSRTYVTSGLAMGVVMIIYSTISILAVLTFGSAVREDLTESYPGREWTTLSAIAIVAIKCLLTLPILFLPARFSILDILNKNFCRFAQLRERWQRYLITGFFISSALMTALYLPDMTTAINLLGFVSVLFIFTLPGIAYLDLVKRNRMEKQQLEPSSEAKVIYTSKDRLKISVSYFMIIFGTVMAILVLHQSIKVMMQGKAKIPLCEVQ